MAGEGVFCHQCRQRTMRRVFSCTSIMGRRHGANKICQSCLKNRYTITDEVAASDDWKCPRCCGNCNCSVCLKRQGKEPRSRSMLEPEKPSDQEELSEANGGEEDQKEDVKGKRKSKAPRAP